MLHNPDKKTKIDLPEELLCAYVDGQTTPQEDREMLEMLAADDNLAMLHDDLKTIMDYELMLGFRNLIILLYLYTHRSNTF